MGWGQGQDLASVGPHVGGPRRTRCGTSAFRAAAVATARAVGLSGESGDGDARRAGEAVPACGWSRVTTA